MEKPAVPNCSQPPYCAAFGVSEDDDDQWMNVAYEQSQANVSVVPAIACTPHLATQPTIDTIRHVVAQPCDAALDVDYGILMAGFIPGLMEHLRLYLSVLHNLTQVAQVCLSSEEVKLRQDFRLSAILAAVSSPEVTRRRSATLDSIESQAKQALLLLRGIIHRHPVLCPLLKTKFVDANEFLAVLGAEFPTLFAMLQKAGYSGRAGSPDQEDSRVVGMNHAASQASTTDDTDWLQLADKLKPKFRLDVKSQNECLERLNVIRPQYRDISVAEACIRLLDVSQFKFLLHEITGAAAWIVAGVIQSSTGIDADAMHLIQRLFEDGLMRELLKTAGLPMPHSFYLSILGALRGLLSSSWAHAVGSKSGLEVLTRLFSLIFAVRMKRKGEDSLKWNADICAGLAVYLQASRTLLELIVSPYVWTACLLPDTVTGISFAFHWFVRCLEGSLTNECVPLPLVREFIDETMILILTIAHKLKILNLFSTWDTLSAGSLDYLARSAAILVESADLLDGGETVSVIKIFDTLITAETARKHQEDISVESQSDVVSK